jgi:hypothetical protein
MKGKPPDFVVLAVSFTNDRLRKGVRNRLRGQLRPKIGPHLAAGDMTVGFTPTGLGLQNRRARMSDCRMRREKYLGANGSKSDVGFLLPSDE